MLTSLENETIFKNAFTDKTVFTRFVKDILGIDFIVDRIETEKKFEPKPGDISISDFSEMPGLPLKEIEKLISD